MRNSLRAASAAICISVTLALGAATADAQARPASPSAAAPTTDAASKLKVILADTQTKLEKSEDSLRPKPNIPPGPAQLIDREYGFDADVVRNDLNAVKANVLDKLQGKEFAGMKAYVTQFYPRAESLKMIPTLGVNYTLATPESVDKTYTEVKAFLGTVAMASSDLMVTLTVESTPAEASVKFWAADDDVHAGHTNQTFEGVYRGWYNYEVKKANYKTITGKINLVTGKPSLRCLLNSETAAEGPLPCAQN